LLHGCLLRCAFTSFIVAHVYVTTRCTRIYVYVCSYTVYTFGWLRLFTARFTHARALFTHRLPWVCALVTACVAFGSLVTYGRTGWFTHTRFTHTFPRLRLRLHHTAHGGVTTLVTHAHAVYVPRTHASAPRFAGCTHAHPLCTVCGLPRLFARLHACVCILRFHVAFAPLPLPVRLLTCTTVTFTFTHTRTLQLPRTFTLPHALDAHVTVTFALPRTFGYVLRLRFTFGPRFCILRWVLHIGVYRTDAHTDGLRSLHTRTFPRLRFALFTLHHVLRCIQSLV